VTIIRVFDVIRRYYRRIYRFIRRIRI